MQVSIPLSVPLTKDTASRHTQSWRESSASQGSGGSEDGRGIEAHEIKVTPKIATRH